MPPTVAQNFVFWGASGHGLVLADIVAAQGGSLLAVFDNNPQQASPWPEVPIYYGEAGFASWLSATRQVAGPPTEFAAAIAIGGARGADRCRLAERFARADLPLPVLQHPNASISPTASIGAGSHVLAGGVVGAAANLGRCVIVNTTASVDHECVLDEGVHIAPGATLCGCVRIGAYSLIGPGAVVLPRINIGRNVIVGAGSVVTHDLPDNVVAWGNPARIIKENLPGEAP
ncbi:MAG TPA: NeuD/PglB/VioB family sugar acetyltransferase [Azospira sp.]|nr:NeuD/PglB/VioB family sugar acetyltransferase [Azospira sp.]